MTDTRYQVFVSSTFTDLREERNQTVSALLQMNCIPAGMELFPAADDEQWQFIKRVIDDCDYYVVIVAGRYGSTTAEGISFTEREFAYAEERGIPVLAFLHADPDSIPLGQSELDPALRARLAHFRERLAKDRLVKFWKSAPELAAQVVLSLNAALKSDPRPGWIRGGGPLPLDLLQEINELRQQKETLENKLRSARASLRPALENLAPLSASTEIKGRLKHRHDAAWQSWSYQTTWDGLIGLIGPELLGWVGESRIDRRIAKAALGTKNQSFWSAELDEENFKTIKVQLLALRVIEMQAGADGVTMFWRLSELGKSVLLQVRTVKDNTRA